MKIGSRFSECGGLDGDCGVELATADARLKPCQKCGRDYFPLRRGYCPRCDMNRRSRIGYESSYIDAAPTRAHIAELVAAGISLRRLATLAGVDRKRLQCLLHGRTDRRTGPSKRISRAVSEKLLAVPVPESPLAVAADGAVVDSIGTVRRLQALVAFGWPRNHLGRRLGWTGGQASCSGNIARLMDPVTTTVRAHTARRVEAMFRELQMTAGPSSRARNEGRCRGWSLPMDWDEDDIDDPAATPSTTDATASLTWLDRYTELKELGYNDFEAMQRIGSNPAAMHRQMARYGVAPDAVLVAELALHRRRRA